MNKSIVNTASDNIRVLSAAMPEKANSGHPGGAMGGADFINILFSEYLLFDPDDMTWANRDRFFLDPGHMSPMLYSILAMFGKYSMDELSNFRQWGSPTPGHPELDVNRGVENTSGPLGQGHTNAVGAAIAAKFLAARFGSWINQKIYSYISDGGVQEEISQGAGRLAGHLGLGNLIMFYDSNDVQLSTTTDHVTHEDTEAKYKAWDWHVVTINGNDQDAIRQALDNALKEEDRPSLIIGKTVMGKGSVDESGESFEGKVSTHGQPLSAAGASFEKTIAGLGGDPQNPFVIFPDVKEYFSEIVRKKKSKVAERRAKQTEWEEMNPELARKYHSYFSNAIPDFDFSQIEQKENVATRAASGTVLGHFAKHINNMIVASADLSNSDKTDGFLKNSKELQRGDFSGAFLQAGVSELTMAAVSNGIALHGGVIAVCGTFFVFSDYMKPAVRLAALMKLPVKYVWTHDAFRVGEDGPTHQPVEHEAQLRLLEHLHNHHGERSMLVLRPADGPETTVAWKMALENTETPTALILSRQGIKNLPSPVGSSRKNEAMNASMGAYIVKKPENIPDLVLVANGSEVSTLIEGAKLLEEKMKIEVQVVSAISEGLFRDQDPAYQRMVLPPTVPTIGLTAGLPVTLAGLVGSKGMVIGMETFGFSAPYEVLDEKLGYNAENVCQQAELFMQGWEEKEAKPSF